MTCRPNKQILRMPTDMDISVDVAVAITGLKLGEKQTIKFLDKVASKLPWFLTPNPHKKSPPHSCMS